MNNIRLNLLEILRFIAALLVILYHITVHYATTNYTFFDNIFKFGYSGVDIFFVLSGFIIFFSLDNKI
jgi:peptidoglycan/LPS O-acetylase OafA/YrhL